MKEAMPYRIFTRQDLVFLQQRIADCLALSQEKWLASPTVAWEIESVENLVQPEMETPLVVEAGIALFAAPEAIYHFYDVMTGDRHHKVTHATTSGIPAALVFKMLRNMLQLMAPASLQGRHTIPTQYRGAGTVQIILKHAQQTLKLLVPQSLVIEYVGSSPAPKGKAQLASRRDGIGLGRLRVRACLGETELRLADLAELAPGHVLRLGLGVDRPFTLINAETGQKLCDAHLGQRDGHKAIQLTK